jgi:hypothetical protein
VHYAAATDYYGNLQRSQGTRPNGHPRERPAFASSHSTDPGPLDAAVGGREGNRGLVLAFGEGGVFRWGKSLSHCHHDDVEAVDLFADGALAVTTTFTLDSTLHTELIAYSRDGALLWRHSLRQRPCPAACFDDVHSPLAIDHSDETAVVAVSSASDDLQVFRVSRTGVRLAERGFTGPELGVDARVGPSGLAVYRGGGARRSPILLAFQRSAVLLEPTFVPVWTRHPGSTTGVAPAGVEVAVCEPDRFNVATVGVEFLSSEHLVMSFDAAGRELWSHRVATVPVPGAPPSYPGPLGLLLGERQNLRCNEQDTPELVMIGTDGTREIPTDIRGVFFTTRGAVHRHYAGTLGGPDFLVGSAGISATSPYFLSLRDGKFHVLMPSALGWTRR